MNTVNLTRFVIFIAFLSSFICVQSSIAALSNVSENLNFIIKIDSKSTIKKDIENLAKEMEQTAKIYKTGSQKSYWANEAKKSFSKLLRSKGYYAHTIDVDIPNGDNDSMVFNINTNVRYKISAISIIFTEKSNKKVNLPNINKIGIKIGDNAVAENILVAEQKILQYAENENCILSLSISHQAEIDHDNKEVKIKFLFDAGSATTLEKVDFVGLATIRPEYVRKLVKLKDNQCLKRSYITEARGHLQKSGLFASTTPIIPQYVNEGGLVPVGFNLTERKARSLKAGLGYETDLGLGAKLGWEHRNFWGSGEEVRADIFGNQKEQTLELNYTKPFFKRDDQTLKLGTKFENIQSKAFLSKEESISGYLERELSPKWTGGAGTVLSHAQVKKVEQGITTNQGYSLISTPVFATYDIRDNVLDARKGWQVELEATPYFHTDSREKPFFKTEIAVSTYLAAEAKLQPVLALRAATGTILSTKSNPIPETEKFYVGGSNSLRGYAYQFASKLDSDNRPLGGMSFVETTIELRLKVSDNIGIVSFLDSGFAYNSQTPSLSEGFLNGAGFGIRYLTNFGPLRLDIGFPLKRRKFVDQAYQLYFGIGQSF